MIIFHKHFFYILSHLLAHVQDFLINQDWVYVYEDVMKEKETIFQLVYVLASGLARAIKKDKSWELTSWCKSEEDQ